MNMADSGWGPYRRGWRAAVVVLVAVGLITAFAFVGWSTIVIAFLMGGTLVASIHLSVGLAQESRTSDLVREVLRWGSRAGLCVVALCGYATAIGAGTLWLLVLIAATSPPLVSWLWPRRPEGRPEGRSEGGPAGRTEGRPEAAPEPRAEQEAPFERKPREHREVRKEPRPEPPPAPEPVAPKPSETRDLADLSDEDLCLRWRRSFTELQSCTTDEQRLAVIAARHAYLDELERRAPDAFAQWLDSGARAAGNPAKYFSPRTNHGDPD